MQPATLAVALVLADLFDAAQSIKEIEHAQAQTVRDDFNGIDRRIRLAGLYSAQVRLIEAASFSELDLGKARLSTKLSHTLSESFC